MLYALVVFTISINLPIAAAHVPDDSSSNDDLENAYIIENPLKSWVFYENLGSNSALYYKFHLHENTRLYLSIFIPRMVKDSGFLPSVAIMNPNISQDASPPAFVEIPSGYNTTLIDGETPTVLEFEPFTPASYYYVLEVDIEQTTHADYVIAVFAEGQDGKFGMALGYKEEFTLAEFLSIPFDLIKIHLWEGQNFFFVFWPLFAIITAGIGIALLWRDKNKKASFNVLNWLTLFSGLFLLGSGALKLQQIFYAMAGATWTNGVFLSLGFALGPMILGLFLVRKAISKDDLSKRKQRLYILILAGIGTIIWSGFYVPIALAVLITFLPFFINRASKREMKHDEKLATN